MSDRVTMWGARFLEDVLLRRRQLTSAACLAELQEYPRRLDEVEHTIRKQLARRVHEAEELRGFLDTFRTEMLRQSALTALAETIESKLNLERQLREIQQKRKYIKLLEHAICEELNDYEVLSDS